MPLTGKFDFEVTMTGKMILIVEEEVPRRLSRDKNAVKLRWRRAKPMDLATPPMRALADLRYHAGGGRRLLPPPQPAVIDFPRVDQGASIDRS
ncbi:hypothetical protein SLNSH_02080 [Alsobacter soli]|uniref:Uncharacterized protein n=1 Tax=Alsobacter soli TaxID=2109933 RepID=A0A2T1HY50_9HYPH|nr:hypothetical protein [Alsobacter soli]PSC06623.1 hypothetical protein SLNSH_02080 [Alsobacter soli]